MDLQKKDGSSSSCSCTAYTYIVIGGGIAGVSCCETLANICAHDTSILLISASPLIKQISNVRRVTKLLESFTVVEESCKRLEERFQNITVKEAFVTHIDFNNHTVSCYGGDSSVFSYEKLCYCAGGSPKIISHNEKYKDCLICVRDTHSAEDLSERVRRAKRVVLVGNGGLATELAFEITGCEIIWVIRDDHINSVFFDPAAAKFLITNLQNEQLQCELRDKRKPEFTIEKSTQNESQNWQKVPSGALGPDWMCGFNLRGSHSLKSIKIVYNAEVDKLMNRSEIESDECVSDVGNSLFPWFVKLTNGELYGCDLVVSATGVVANVNCFGNKESSANQISISEEGGIIVDDQMRSNLLDIYAAGDVCNVDWPNNKNWFQMKIWPQARQMGQYAAKCMEAHRNGEADILMDFCFEVFEHFTYFLGQRVVLLGLFNGQGLDKYDILCRMTPGTEFIKLVIHDGKVRGAVLIGDTELAETIENLILGEFDVTDYGESLLDPNIDLADYFD